MKWEDEPRYEHNPHLLSQLMPRLHAKKLALKMCEMTPQKNHDAISIVQSQQLNQFRIMIELDKFKLNILTRKEMLIIAAF